MQHALHGGRLVEAAPEAIGVEAVQQRDEALALRPEPEIAGHPDVVEEDFVVIDVAGETADRPDVHASRPVGHHEHAEAAAPTRLAAGAGKDEAVARDARVARPDLVAADHVVVTITPGFGLQPEEVGAGAGLAVALPERRFAPGDRRQHLAAQALAAVLDDRVRRLPAASERPERRASQRQLFEQDELEEHRPLLPAVRLRPRHAQPALLGQCAEEGARVGARAVARVHPVDGEAVGWMRGEEAPDLGGEGLLVGGVREVHERRGLYPVPQREAGGREVLVEADDVPARERFHDREADGIGVGDGTRRHALDPATRRCMVIRRRKMNRDALAGVDTFERP